MNRYDNMVALYKTVMSSRLSRCVLKTFVTRSWFPGGHGSLPTLARSANLFGLDLALQKKWWKKLQDKNRTTTSITQWHCDSHGTNRTNGYKRNFPPCKVESLIKKSSSSKEPCGISRAFTWLFWPPVPHAHSFVPSVLSVLSVLLSYSCLLLILFLLFHWVRRVYWTHRGQPLGFWHLALGQARRDCCHLAVRGSRNLSWTF